MHIPDNFIKDLKLAVEGQKMIKWAEDNMPVLCKIKNRFEKERPLEGERVSACLHITKETAVLMKVMRLGGADVSLCASNPISTQDSIASALVEDGIRVYGIRGEDIKQYYSSIAFSLSSKPTITIDDGADLVGILHQLHYKEETYETKIITEILGEDSRKLIDNIHGGCEETTTGIIRLRNMAKNNVLRYPIIAVNDAQSKSLFDNPIGTGQSALDGILRATNTLIAGKNVVVIGYGRVGSGIAERFKGLGGRVTIIEVNPINALRAVMFGFNVDTLENASEYGDIFITATGNLNVIRKEHIQKMKNQAILANAGHFDVEISKNDFKTLEKTKNTIRQNLDQYTLPNGNKIYLLAEGRLVNLGSAEGHPSEVMDLSFSVQALSVEYIVKNKGQLSNTVINLPTDIDTNIARMKLEEIGIKIDRLTEEQQRYLYDWNQGTN